MDIQATAASTAASGTARAGKSGQAVGQQAKAAVVEARAAGIDLPKSAQGMAASAIAKGAEPGSVFAALAVPEAKDARDTEAATTEEPPMQAPALAEAGYGEAADVFGEAALSAGETALNLLAGRDA